MPSTHVSLTYHVVFSTKNREPLIAKSWRERLYEYLGGCIRTAGGVSLEIGGTSDHIHILLGLKATHRVADLLRDVKRATSAWVRETVVPNFAWQEGYGAFTVGGNDYSDLIRYIRGQEEHHRVRTFQEEYREFLTRYGVEFDERYLW
jgi:putative transposase